MYFIKKFSYRGKNNTLALFYFLVELIIIFINNSLICLFYLLKSFHQHFNPNTSFFGFLFPNESIIKVKIVQLKLAIQLFALMKINFQII
jgi:hypothetical protein